MFVFMTLFFFNSNNPESPDLNSVRPCEEFAPHVCSFIQSVRYLAEREMRHHGIPSSITIAQAILESGYGTSVLAIEGNNYFGIKGGYNQCEIYYKLEYYRCYDFVSVSFEDHSDFLLKKAPILALIRDGNIDHLDWAETIQEIDYATDPEYAEKLIDIIRRYDLVQFDIKDQDIASEKE
ncbi:MAG: glycoside hydrolase family 73 protein, partial [Saprospiraceae bacterium]